MIAMKPEKNDRKKKTDSMDIRGKVREKMRDSRKVFKVYRILRALVLVCLVRQFLHQNYENVLLCVLTLVLFLLPAFLQVKLRVVLPQELEITLLFFIYAAEILGEVNCYYTAIPMWDTILHTLNGFLAAAVGFSLTLILNHSNRVVFELSPFYICVVAFCFSMTIGAVWEIFEFSMDCLFGADMQKDTVIHTISSITLNTQGLQRPVRISNITETAVNGQVLGISGYLDIGIFDTMADLIVNFIGALIFCAIGYLAQKGKMREFDIVQRLMIRPSDAVLEKQNGESGSRDDGVAAEQETNTGAETENDPQEDAGNPVTDNRPS